MEKNTSICNLKNYTFVHNNYEDFEGFVIVLGKYIYTSPYPAIPVDEASPCQQLLT